MKKKTKLLTLAAASLLSLGLAAGITVHAMNDEPAHDDVLVDEIGGEDAVGIYNAFPARAIDPSELDAIHGTIGVQLLGEEGNHSVRFVVALSGYQGLESASFTRTVKAGDGTVIMQEKVLGIRQVYSSVASAATIDWGGEAPSATDYPYYMVYTMNKISKEYEYATIEVKFTAEQLANPGTPLTAVEKANVKGLIGQTETYDYLNFQEIEGTSDIYEKPGEYRVWENDNVPADLVIPEDYIIYGGHVATVLGKVVAVEDPATGYGAFESCKDIVSVTLPDTIRYLDKWCFSGASNLKTLNIPASLKTVEPSAFSSVNLDVLRYDAVNLETWSGSATISSANTVYVSSGVTSLPDAKIVSKVNTVYYDGLTADWNALNDGKTTGLDIDNVICNDTQVATITFHTNGGTFTVNGAETTEDFTLDVIVGKLIPDVGRGKKDGLVFAYWSTSEDGSTGAYDFETPISGDLDLYAIFTEAPAGSSMDKPLVVDVEKSSHVRLTLETNEDVPLQYLKVTLPADGRFYLTTDESYKMWIYDSTGTTMLESEGSVNPSIVSETFPIMGNLNDKIIFNTTEAITYYVVLAYGYDYKIDGPNANEYGTMIVDIFDAPHDTIEKAVEITEVPSTYVIDEVIEESIKSVYHYVATEAIDLVIKIPSGGVTGRADVYVPNNQGDYSRPYYVSGSGQTLVSLTAGDEIYIEAYSYITYGTDAEEKFTLTIDVAPDGVSINNPASTPIVVGTETTVSSNNIGGFGFGYYPMTVDKAADYRVIMNGGSSSTREVSIYEVSNTTTPVLSFTSSSSSYEELVHLEAGEYIVGAGYTSEYATLTDFKLLVSEATPGYSIDYPVELQTSWVDNSLTLESRTEDTYYKLTDGIGNGYDMTLSGEGATSVTIFDSSKKEIAEIALSSTTYVKLESETECYYILVPATETPGANVTLSRTEHIGALTGSVLLGEYYGVRNGSSYYKVNVTADGYTWESSSTVYNATTAPVETTNGYYTFTVQQDAEGKVVKTFTGNGEYMWIDEVNSSYGTSYNVYFMTQASKASYNSSSLSGEGAGTLDYDETGEGVYIQSLVESLAEGSPRVYAIKIDGVVYLDVDVVFTSGTELDGSGATYTVSYNGTELGTGTYETGRLVWTPAA
jgi:hypothetical protein